MKRLLLIMLLLLTAFQGFSQTKGISYQAVILNPNPQQLPGQNAENNILANSAVSIQFTIVNASGTEEYQEKHSTRTDRYGMINLLIGTGTPTSSNDFSDIFWNGTTKKLKVGIDFKGGTNFSALSEQNLTYMPQPPTEEVTIEITNNSANIEKEKTRALQAEQSNAGGISALQAEQIIQNTAIALNTTKVGVTPEQASTIGNTTGINTGDQDISGIAINASAITTLQGEQTTQNTAIALNAAKTGITSQQASDITANNAKVGITSQQASDITANNTKVGITTAQASEITANTLKTGITSQQASDITANNAKVGITSQQASDITANNTKVGITAQQTSDITANNAKVGYTEALVSANTDVVANTAKVGITSQQTSDITVNNAKVGYTESLVSANTNVAANTAKVGITAQQASDITANNAKVGITTTQASEITANTLKTGITSQQASDITANNAKVGITSQQTSDITANNAKVGITSQQASDITANNAKVGITTVQADAIVANTLKVGITSQQTSDITVNNAKVGYTEALVSANTNVAANTAKNSYLSADATKLSGIEAGAQVNVQSNWNATSGDAQILNKPTIPAAADGSETKVTAGTNVTVTGTGTTASPYVVNAAAGGGSASYTIGLSAEQGGYIFWVSSDGKHGLVAETIDQGTATWYEAQNVISNPANHSPNGQNFRDWRLPTNYELNEINLQKVAIGNFYFAIAPYWSATEEYSYIALSQNFDDGYQFGQDKDYPNSVRAVRAF